MEKELYSLQAKRSYPFKYFFLTKKGLIILAVSVVLSFLLSFSLPLPLPLRQGLFVALTYIFAKLISSQFPILESDVRHSFLQKWWKKKWEIEKGECKKEKLAKTLKEKYGRC